MRQRKILKDVMRDEDARKSTSLANKKRGRLLAKPRCIKGEKKLNLEFQVQPQHKICLRLGVVEIVIDAIRIRKVIAPRITVSRVFLVKQVVDEHGHSQVFELPDRPIVRKSQV